MSKSGFVLTNADESPNITLMADAKSGTTADITVSPGMKSKLTFATQPSTSSIAGIELEIQPVVAVQDDYGNLTTVGTTSVTLAAVLSSDDSTPGNGTLNSALNPVNASSGLATYSEVNYNLAESIKLKASANSLTEALSNEIAISELSADNFSHSVGFSTATIAWTTNGNSSSKVDYGPLSSYWASSTESDLAPRVMEHNVVLTDLIPCSIYHYRVRSKASGGNEATGSDDTFNTTGCTGNSSIVKGVSVLSSNADGGRVDLENGGVRISIDIPSGFSGSDAAFQIQQLEPSAVTSEAVDDLDNLDVVGEYIFDIHAMSINNGGLITSFNNNVDITMTYGESEKELFSEQTLAMYKYHNGGWNSLAGCAIASASGTITCATDTFSVFALFGSPTQNQSVAVNSRRITATGSYPRAATLLEWLYVPLKAGLSYFPPAGFLLQANLLQIRENRSRILP